MSRTLIAFGVAAIGSGALGFAALADPGPASPGPANEPPRICKKVVDNKPGSTPYELCMTKAEWDAKKIADAKDPNRMICHYEEKSGTRFRSAKVCMTAQQWWDARQADRQAVEQIQAQTCVPGAGC